MIVQFLAELDISGCPKWFHDFYEKYRTLIFPHITLTQARKIDSSATNKYIEGINSKVREYLPKTPLRLQVDQIRTDCTEEGEIIMLGTPSEELSILQKKLLEFQGNQFPLVYPNRKQYEEEYWPHMTVAVNVPVSELIALQTRYDFNDLVFSVRNILCLTVTDENFHEVNDPNNHVILHKTAKN